MPSVLIEVRRQYTPDQEAALIDGVHRALVQAFKIPQSDRTARFVSHEPHRFVCSPKIANADRFTQITIECFAGRSLEAKRALYRAITTNLTPLGVPAESVQILLNEFALENWGLRGGKAACDVDLGFEVGV